MKIALIARIVLCTFIGLLYFTVPAQAQESPEKIVSQFTAQSLSTLQKNGAGANASESSVIELERRLRAVADSQFMARIATGRPWKNATEAQRTELEKEIVHVIAKTLANGFLDYAKSQPSYSYPESGMVVVSFASPRPLVVEFLLQQQGQGKRWLIFDILFSGVSVVASHRENFAGTISANGIDGLISMLKQRNQGTGQQSSAAATGAIDSTRLSRPPAKSIGRGLFEL